MLHERYKFGVTVVDGKIYALGGNYVPITITPISSGASSVTFSPETTVAFNEEYDPNTDSWIARAPMPAALGGFYAVGVVENKIHCIKGAVHEVYDPATNIWTYASAMPIPSTSFQTAGVVNGKIYVIAVGDPQGNLNQFYDPTTDSWTAKTPPPYCNATYGLTAIAINDKIYLVADTIQVYDTAADSWCLVTTIPTPAQYEAAVATTGAYAARAIYIMGGRSPTNPIGTWSTVQVYFLENGTWGSGIPKTINSSMAQGTAVINDIIYLMGGQHNIFTPQVNGNQMYIPQDYNSSVTATPSPTPLSTQGQSAFPQPTSSNQTVGAEPTDQPSFSSCSQAYFLLPLWA
jgi:hypothetical protein